MPATLSSLQTRMAQYLFDTGNSQWSANALAEGLRLALGEYSGAFPLETETYIVLPGTSREIALGALSGLIDVLDVWYPYDPAVEQFPPNRVNEWELRWDDGSPVLYVIDYNVATPALNDEMRIFYTKPHTINGLDSASSTTFFPDHEDMIVRGAAGLCAQSRSVELIETSGYGTRPSDNARIEAWGNARLFEFRYWLKQLKTATRRQDVKAWELD